MAKKLGDQGTADAAPDQTGSAPANTTPETFHDAVQEISAIQGQKKAINETYKAARKKWKAAGIHLGDLDYAVRMADWEPEEVQESWNRRRKYCEFLGLPVGKQGNLFEGKDENEAQMKYWESRGLTAARAGKSSDPPEGCPEEFRLAFKRGFQKGKTPMSSNPAGKKKDKAGADSASDASTDKDGAVPSARAEPAFE